MIFIEALNIVDDDLLLILSTPASASWRETKSQWDNLNAIARLLELKVKAPIYQLYYLMMTYVIQHTNLRELEETVNQRLQTRNSWGDADAGRVEWEVET